MAEPSDDAKIPTPEGAPGDEKTTKLTPEAFAASAQYRERVSAICNLHNTGHLVDDGDLSDEAERAVALLAKESGKPDSAVKADVYEAAPGVDAENDADNEDRYGNLDEYGEPRPPLGDLNKGAGDDDDWDDSRI
ncbi:hypothetical protein QCE73_12465 [Caballeronia sp. LZ029]|uniref:hypothetical protein n=1 Tax=Caballeronia sp. LZ029 TaxID=3038564 RepID=UPI0028554CB3|nr:hypothetical protein [Caballeronia sp. LZ029]MDR5743965.1 hypothetical protein [Caballeronia sp. LZ029]